MVLDTNYSMSSFSNKETIKMEILDILLSCYKDSDIVIDNDCKDFILSNVEKYIEEYGQVDNYLNTVKFESPEGEYTGEYVEVGEVEKVIEQFQYNMAKLLIKIVSYDLSVYLAKREGNLQ